MKMTHDFKGALKFIQNVEKRYGAREEYNPIQVALSIADRLQRGKVSVRMMERGTSTLLTPKLKTGHPLGSETAEAVAAFKAMAAQLIKECE